LPNLNWPVLIQRIMRAGLGEAVELQCIRFGITHISNAALASWVSSCSERLHFAQLASSVQLEIIQSLPKLLMTFGTTRAKQLIVDLSQRLLACEQASGADRTLMFAYVEALRASLLEPGMYASTVSEIHNSIWSAYCTTAMPVQPACDSPATYELHCDGALQLYHIVECMALMPEQVLNTNLLVSVSEAAIADRSQQHKAVFATALLVHLGKLPLRALVRCRTWFFSQSDLAIASALLSVLVLPLVQQQQQQATASISDDDWLQWLLDCFDAVSMCEQPAAAVRYIAATLLTSPALLDVMLVLAHSPSVTSCNTEHHQALLRKLLVTIDTPERILPAVMQQFVQQQPNSSKRSMVLQSITKRLYALVANEHLPTHVRRLFEQCILDMKRNSVS
jgi:hypothetical protein